MDSEWKPQMEELLMQREIMKTGEFNILQRGLEGTKRDGAINLASQMKMRQN
jgi:hypothetical protein